VDEPNFWLHRLAVARAARDAGAEVIVMTRLGQYHSLLEQEGFRIIPWRISRRSLRPVQEVLTFLEVLKAYRREEPQLVHHVALKAIIYGGAAARFCGEIPAVNAVAGLGRVFTISTTAMLTLRRVLSIVLRWVFEASNCKVTFENDDDRDLLVTEKIIAPAKTVVIPGVGIDTEYFSPRPEPDGVPVVMLPSRMLWEKGVAQFVEAARELRERGVSARFVLVGAPDLESRGYIPESQLRSWADAGIVEWWGTQGDMPAVLSKAHVVCLPSYYREGLPRVLIEAAACGRAIVTTDAPGCRQVVRHGENGLLVPVKDARALAAAIFSILQNPKLREQMGAAGRARAVSEFSQEMITEQTLALYSELLNSRSPRVDKSLGNPKL
jgi:glycosyltransferase involved in cell wall biosynthesis